MDMDLAVIISLVLDHKCYFGLRGSISFQSSTPVPCLYDCFPEEAMLLSLPRAEKITSVIEDADLEEGSGNTFSSHCFKWTLLNVQEPEASPAACRSVVLFSYSPHKHFK